MVLDKETQALLRKANAFKGLVSQSGWPEMKAQLLEDLGRVVDTRQIKDPEKAAFQVAVRNEVYRLLSNWIQKLESGALVTIQEPKKKDYIVNFEKPQ